MSRKSKLQNVAILFLAVSFVLLALRPLAATPVPGESPDFVIKISDLEKNLTLLDNVFGKGDTQVGASFSAQIRQMLQDTNWIDHSRAIVIGVVIQEPMPIAAALVPFRQPNEAFQANYNASKATDYYIVPLPPDRPVGISDVFKSSLSGASRSKSKSFVTIDIGLRRLMEQNEQQIRQMLSRLENMPAAQGAQDMTFSPQDVRGMMVNMLDTAAQLETLTFSLDFNEEKLSIHTEAKAASGSELAKLFVSQEATSLLNHYTPEHDINFKSRSYNFSGLLKIVGNGFGKIYEKMGFDFGQIAAIMEHYTGEMAGGISFSQDTFHFEGIDVLKNATSPANFVETVYLPWIEKFSQTMIQKIEELNGQKIENPFVRTAESQVAGYKVYGAKFKLPDLPDPGAEVRFPERELMYEFEWRFTTVGNLFVFAESDQELGKLIKIAKTLKPGPAKGPLMAMDFDLGSYMELIRQSMPNGFGSDRPLPTLGKMNFALDFKDGQAFTTSSIRMKDIKNIVAYFSQAAFGTTQASMNFDDENGTLPEFAEDQPEPEKEEEKVKIAEARATDWFKKGALCATYGNDRAAIKYFEKALALDPQHSGAYFEQGISYGQLGEYDKAIPLLNMAVQMEPQNGLYYYGRGRVYLLAGDKEKAMVDFKKAAQLGDEDAINYLEYIRRAKNG